MGCPGKECELKWHPKMRDKYKHILVRLQKVSTREKAE